MQNNDFGEKYVKLKTDVKVTANLYSELFKLKMVSSISF